MRRATAPCPELALALALALALGLTSARAWADDSDLVGILDSHIVTTASQTAETASTAPATSTIIGADDLRRYGIHTLEEAINFLALGVSSAGGPTIFSGADLGARGVALANDGGSHFLLLVDGHAVNEPYSGGIALDYGTGIPLELVDRIEVIVGPGSVLYGSNAMLGVINIVTQDTVSSSGGRVLVETEAPVGHRVAMLGGLSWNLGTKRLDVTAAAQYVQQYGPDFRLGPQRLGIDPVSGRPARTTREGPETGIWGGLADKSSYARYASGMLRLRLADLELSVRGSLHRKGRPFLSTDFNDPDSPVIGRRISLDLTYGRLLTPRLRLGVRGYADAIDARDIGNFSSALACAYPDVATCKYESRLVSRWAGGELQATYDWIGDATLTTLVGSDLRTRYSGAKQDVSDLRTHEYLANSTGLADVTDYTLGTYAQQIWWPLPALGLNAGARLDSDRRFAAVISPRAAASLAGWPGGTLRSIYSEAFRAPSFYESTYGDLLVAKPESLQPETVRSVEASLEQKFGSHRVFFGVFRSWWRDLIGLRFLTFEQAQTAAERGLLPFALPNAAHAQNQNATTVGSYGFNASAEGSFLSQRLRYGLHVTEAYSRREDPDIESELLPTAPRLTMNARLAYGFAAPWPGLGLAGYLLAPRPADRGVEAGFRPAPVAPTQVDVRLTATGSVPGVESLTYRLSTDFVFGARSPYVIGAALVGTPDNPRAELGALPPFRISLGIEYGFGDE